MVQARWNGIVLADSDRTLVVEGNHYFPREDVRMENLKDSAATTSCPWKGTARYYDVVAGDQTNPSAAWYYGEPKPAASQIEGRIAFWKGVEVG